MIKKFIFGILATASLGAGAYQGFKLTQIRSVHAGYAIWGNGTSLQESALTGDLGGSMPSPSVLKVNGVALGSMTATDAHILVANGTQWVSRSMTGDVAISDLGATSVTGIQGTPFSVTAPTTSQFASYNGTNWLGVSLSGDGSLSGGALTVGKINGVSLGSTTATSGNVLIGSGTSWVTNAISGDATLSSSGVVAVTKINGATLGTTTATSGNLLIGQGSTWATKAMSGDGTIDSTGNFLLSNTAVTAAAYGCGSSFTVNGKGLLTSATAPTGTPSSSTYLRGDGVWSAVSGASGGTITSVAQTVPSWLSVSGSPITSSGTLAITAATGQTANSFLASPDGSTGALSVRAMVAADLPNHSAALLTSGTVGTARLGSGTANNTMFLRGDQTWQPFTSGTVTSVAATVPTWLSLSGSPITTSGTLAFTGATGLTANQVVGTDSGGNVILQALTAAHIPNLSTAKLTSGLLPPARGGTGTDFSGALTGSLIYFSATGVSSELGIGSTGQVLKVVGGIPTWVTPLTLAVRETPSGTVDGSNATFTLAHTPSSGTESVYLNGVLQEPGAGNDYTISGGTITMLTAPVSGSRLRVTYQY